MTADPKVSPRPWRADSNYLNGAVALDDKDGCGVLFHQAAWKPTKENIAHIVRCVNAHDGLAEALERFLAASDDSCDASPDHDDVAAMMEYGDAFNNLRAALAAAKEGA